MGNFLSCRTLGGPTGRIVLPDGTVHAFDRPVHVAELMLDHPQHFVVELPPPSAGGSKLTPLPADNTVAPDKVYLILPMARGKSAVASVDQARRILVTQSAERPRSLQSLVRDMCMVGAARKKGEAAGIKANEESACSAEKYGPPELSPETLAEGPELLSRQYSSKGWKPSLGTIVERGLERKVAHWLF